MKINRATQTPLHIHSCHSLCSLMSLKPLPTGIYGAPTSSQRDSLILSYNKKKKKWLQGYCSAPRFAPQLCPGPARPSHTPGAWPLEVRRGRLIYIEAFWGSNLTCLTVMDAFLGQARTCRGIDWRSSLLRWTKADCIGPLSKTVLSTTNIL